MPTVVADKYIYKLEEVIPEEVNLVTFDPDYGFPQEVHEADALLVRTVSRIDRTTLPLSGSKLRFVGTASAGYDHIDTDYLYDNGVAFAHSPGCNANSVAEYVITSLLIWSEHTGNSLDDVCVGVIGHGHVGTATTRFFDGLNIDYLTYDPPREKRDGSYRSASLGDVLQCDILTFHTPLTFVGDYPTYHWLSDSILNKHSYRLIINAARGRIIEEKALLNSLKTGHVESYILDVWEHEPMFNPESAENALIATPHIAGYSLEAKNNATRQVVVSMVNELGKGPINKLATQTREIQQPNNNGEFRSLSHLLKTVHPILDYDKQLRQISSTSPSEWERGAAFNLLRTQTTLRHEFDSIALPNQLFERYPILNELKFSKAEL